MKKFKVLTLGKEQMSNHSNPGFETYITKLFRRRLVRKVQYDLQSGRNLCQTNYKIKDERKIFYCDLKEEIASC